MARRHPWKPAGADTLDGPSVATTGAGKHACMPGAGRRGCPCLHALSGWPEVRSGESRAVVCPEAVLLPQSPAPSRDIHLECNTEPPQSEHSMLCCVGRAGSAAGACLSCACHSPAAPAITPCRPHQHLTGNPRPSRLRAPIVRLRLVNGKAWDGKYANGRLEVLYNNVWGTVSALRLCVKGVADLVGCLQGRGRAAAIMPLPSCLVATCLVRCLLHVSFWRPSGVCRGL